MKRKYLPGTIRDSLPELMREKKITQIRLAEFLGVTPETVSRFVNGRTDKISPAALVRMARLFGVSTDFLLGETNDPARRR